MKKLLAVASALALTVSAVSPAVLATETLCHTANRNICKREYAENIGK